MIPVWLLICAIGVIGANALALSPIAGDVALSLAGREAADVLLASAVYGAGTAASALALAPHADRIGLRRALLWALSVLVGALGLSAAAPTLSILVLGQGLAGLAAGLALPAIYGLAAEIAPSGRASETLGRVLTGWTLSLVVGVSLSALLSDVLSWRAVYAALALTTLGLILPLRGPGARAPRGTAPVATPLAALRVPGVRPVLGSVALYMVAFYGLYAYLGTHLTNALGLSTSLAGLTALAYGLGFGAVAPLDRLIDRFGALRSAPLVFAGLLGAYLLLGAVSASYPPILAACLLWGAINHLGLNILVGNLTALATDLRGAVLGLYGAVTYAAMFAGTAAYKPLFDIWGFAGAACLSAGCIAPVVLAALRRRRAARDRAGISEVPLRDG